MVDVDVNTLQKRFINPDAGFQQPLDAVKIALVLLTKTFLFELDYKTKVSSWLFSLIEELEQFNNSPWGNMFTK